MRGFMKPMTAAPLALLALSVLATANAQLTREQMISGLGGGGSSRGIGAAKPAGQPAAVSQPAPQAVQRPAAAPVSQQRPAAHTAAPVRAPVAAAAPAANPSVNLTVDFPSGSAALTPRARASLDVLGSALSSNELASFRFRIEGHTDTVGSSEDNRALSQKRAEAVVSYLANQYRIQPSRLEAVGMGQDSPLVATPPQTPNAQNRRVQVIKLGA